MNDINYVNIYKYIFDDIIIINKNKKYTIKKEFVSSFFIEKDFNNDLFPVFRVQCLVNASIKNVINMSDSEYIINIKKGMTRLQSDGTLLKKSMVYDDFINGRFMNINSDNKSVSLTDDINKSNDTKPDTGENSDLQNSTNLVELYLFKKDYVESSRNLTDKIYNSVGVIDVMMSLLSDNIKNKCLISYPDNRKIYDNIILPNNVSLKGGIKYLHDVYGIYNTSYILFIDFDITYMINKSINCNAYQKNEIRSIYLDFNPITKMKGNIYGQIKNNQLKNIVIYSLNEPHIIDYVSNMDKSMYSEVKAIDTYSNDVHHVKLDGNDNKAVKIIDNKYNNKYYINSHMYELQSLKTVIEAELNEVDVDILVPNKEFYIKFNKNTKHAKELEGNYKLIKCITTFVKKDDNSFVSTSIVTFTR